jgi:hypothetical protein
VLSLTIEQQRKEIAKLKEAQYELNELKGQHMLLAFDKPGLLEETKS